MIYVSEARNEILAATLWLCGEPAAPCCVGALIATPQQGAAGISATGRKADSPRLLLCRKALLCQPHLLFHIIDALLAQRQDCSIWTKGIAREVTRRRAIQPVEARAVTRASNDLVQPPAACRRVRRGQASRMRKREKRPMT